MDRFDKLVTEKDQIGLAANLKYAISLQFVDRLEKSGKTSTVERLTFKNAMEDVNGEPRVEDVS